MLLLVVLSRGVDRFLLSRVVGRIDSSFLIAWIHSSFGCRDLDVMDGMEPVVTLGRSAASGRKNKRGKDTSEGHSSPVLALQKNPQKT